MRFSKTLVYVVVSALSLLSLSDEFDFTKSFLAAYIGFPIFLLTVLLDQYFRGWRRQFRFVQLCAQTAVLLAFLPGHLAVVNAALGETASVKVTQSIASRAVISDQHRGGLGVLYARRW